MGEQETTAQVVSAAVQALNALMQNTTVADNDKHVVKINRFKKWIISTYQTVKQ